MLRFGLYHKIASTLKPLTSQLYKIGMCRCAGHKSCLICWGAMEASYDKKYKEMEAEGMEDYLEAKEFMWDFFDKRDQRGR